MKFSRRWFHTTPQPGGIGNPATPGMADKADFKLLRFFTSASLVAFVVVALSLGFVFRSLSIDGLLKGHESEHVNQAQIIANELWDDAFGPLSVAMSGKTAAERQNAEQIPAIHQKVLRLLKGTKIFKIKVYDLKGITVYSTERQQIGEDKSNNEGVINGLLGHNSAALVHQDQFSAFEGEVQNRDLVETYVPRYDPVTREVSGVFEIYGDATEVLADIVTRQWSMVFTVVTLLSLLYLVLLLIVKTAQNLIFLQNKAREAAQESLALSEERWKFALEGAGDGVWDRNLQTGEVVYSKRYREIYGFADNDLTNHHEAWDERVHPEDLSQVRAHREAYFAGQTQLYANERRMRCKDGSWKWILSRGMVVSRDTTGQPLRMIGTHTDITQRHAHEEALQLASTVLQTMDEAVVVTKTNNEIISVNPSFTVITGYTAAEVIGKNPKLLSSATHSQAFYADMWHQLGTRGSWHGEIQNRNKTGQLYVEWLSIKQVRNPEGVPTHYVAVFSDISERKASEQRMHHLAHFDVLTGLPNRALFSDRLRQTLAKARRDKTRVALMFIDLDKFKPVNDTLGHHVGDLLLKAVAQRLNECVRRESDTVGRLGGDEFVVMLPEIESSSDVLQVAEKILLALNKPFEMGPLKHVIQISSSIGIALFPEHGDDESGLLKSADAAMYRAKEAGSNRAEFANGA
jgi:diguanylate cyclase (GGDEF)-like protein/PAS domain S-box-containing protein